MKKRISISVIVLTLILILPFNIAHAEDGELNGEFAGDSNSRPLTTPCSFDFTGHSVCINKALGFRITIVDEFGNQYPSSKVVDYVRNNYSSGSDTYSVDYNSSVSWMKDKESIIKNKKINVSYNNIDLLGNSTKIMKNPFGDLNYDMGDEISNSIENSMIGNHTTICTILKDAGMINSSDKKTCQEKINSLKDKKLYAKIEPIYVFLYNTKHVDVLKDTQATMVRVRGTAKQMANHFYNVHSQYPFKDGNATFNRKFLINLGRNLFVLQKSANSLGYKGIVQGDETINTLKEYSKGVYTKGTDDDAYFLTCGPSASSKPYFLTLKESPDPCNKNSNYRNVVISYYKHFLSRISDPKNGYGYNIYKITTDGMNDGPIEEDVIVECDTNFNMCSSDEVNSTLTNYSGGRIKLAGSNTFFSIPGFYSPAYCILNNDLYKMSTDITGADNPIYCSESIQTDFSDFTSQFKGINNDIKSGIFIGVSNFPKVKVIRQCYTKGSNANIIRNKIDEINENESTKLKLSFLGNNYMFSAPGTRGSSYSDINIYKSIEPSYEVVSKNETKSEQGKLVYDDQDYVGLTYEVTYEYRYKTPYLNKWIDILTSKGSGEEDTDPYKNSYERDTNVNPNVPTSTPNGTYETSLTLMNIGQPGRFSIQSLMQRGKDVNTQYTLTTDDVCNGLCNVHHSMTGAGVSSGNGPYNNNGFITAEECAEGARRANAVPNSEIYIDHGKCTILKRTVTYTCIAGSWVDSPECYTDHGYDGSAPGCKPNSYQEPNYWSSSSGAYVTDEEKESSENSCKGSQYSQTPPSGSNCTAGDTRTVTEYKYDWGENDTAKWSKGDSCSWTGKEQMQKQLYSNSNEILKAENVCKILSEGIDEFCDFNPESRLCSAGLPSNLSGSLNNDDCNVAVKFTNKIDEAINDSSCDTTTIVDNKLTDPDNPKNLLDKLVYRPIDPTNPFPGTNGTGRSTTDFNWSEENIKKYIKERAIGAKNDVYSKKPLYSITLTPNTIKNIKNYNSNNPYDDFELTCDKNGTNCRSNFLRTTVTLNTNSRCYYGPTSAECTN